MRDLLRKLALGKVIAGLLAFLIVATPNIPASGFGIGQLGAEFGRGGSLGVVGIPAWVLPGETVVLNWSTQQGWIAGVGIAPISSLAAATRAALETTTDLSGNLSLAANNTLAASNAGGQLFGPATNVIVSPRDFTNAAWTKSNATVALDQVGADGAANSASSFLATANNATVTQAITLASSARFQTAYIKRLAGSGEADISLDGGTTFYDVTAQINSVGYARVSPPGKTLANPSVVIRITTSGDKIAVDYVQNENHAFATPAISPAGTRPVDLVLGTALLRSLVNISSGTVRSAFYTTPNSPALVWAINDNSSSNQVDLRSNQIGLVGSFIAVGGSNQSSIGASSVGGSGLFATAALSWAAGVQQLAVNGILATPAAPASVPASSSAINFGSGGGTASTNPLYGNMLLWAYSPNVASGSQVQALSSQLASGLLPSNTLSVFGDSLTASNQDGTGILYTSVLANTFSPTRKVLNEGIGGQTSPQILARAVGTPYLHAFNAIGELGRNNSSSTAQVLSDVAAFYALFPKALMLSVLNGEGEGTGTSVYTNIVSTINPALASAYGANYLDYRSALVAAFNPANPVDVIDNANDIPPFTLRAKYPGTIVGAITPISTSFSVTLGVGSAIAANFILQVGSEYIYVLAGSGTSVTNCIRGYAGTTPGSYGAGQAMVATDNLHLGFNGYTLKGQLVGTKAQALGL